MDLIGHRFGNLIVEKVHSKGHSTFWFCKCDCGEYTKATTSQLKRGNKKSCGCLRRNKAKTLRERTGGNTLPAGQSSFNKLFYQYRIDAKKRGLKFLLTEAQFKELVDSNCHYCDSQPSEGFVDKARNGSYLHNGIDRRSSSAGYTKENCLPCCSFCNRMKWDLDYHDFIARCGVVYLTRK